MVVMESGAQEESELGGGVRGSGSGCGAGVKTVSSSIEACSGEGGTWIGGGGSISGGYSTEGPTGVGAGEEERLKGL